VDIRRLLSSSFKRVSVNDAGGQAAIALAATMLLWVFLAFIVIDIGFWYADRRDAQADADAVALAGAIELPDFADDAAAVARANARAMEWALANGVAASEITIDVVRTCFSANDEVHTGVRAVVSREPSSFLLGLIEDVGPIRVETSATACSGMPAEMNGFMPWAVQTAGACFQEDPDDTTLPIRRIPIFGERCDLVVGGQGGASGDVGQLAFDPDGACPDGNSSASEYSDQIVSGVSTTCAVGDSVSSNTGVNVGPTKQGLAARLAGEGQCSLDAVPFFSDVSARTIAFNASLLTDLAAPTMGSSGGLVDDLFEIWGPAYDYDATDPAKNLDPYPCADSSPRHVTLIVIGDIAIDDGTDCNGGNNSPHCYIVRGFARMYVEGCSTTPDDFSAKCDQQGGGGSFTIHGRFVSAASNSSLNLTLNPFGEAITFLKE
jgi:hypothetical protein